MSDDTNPKDRLGVLKVPLDLVPMAGVIYEALAFAEGAIKYGEFNWRNKAVRRRVYLAAILHAWWRGLGFGGALTILYAALYGILRSEQNALLLGSLLLFLALAGLMLGTRKIDWYRLGKSSTAESA